MEFQTSEGVLSFEPEGAIVAGWTGRDAAAVQHHIDELAEIGVAPPSQFPLYYRVSAALVTQTDEIEVLGDGASGEVEAVIFQKAGKRWLTIGSDHTDRALEAHSVAHSKQICAKPVGREAWAFDSVQDLDAVQLKAWIGEGDEQVLYMDGVLAQMRPISELIEGASLRDGDIMFCGALPAIGGVRPSTVMTCRMSDPGSGRSIELSYRAHLLPVVA